MLVVVVTVPKNGSSAASGYQHRRHRRCGGGADSRWLIFVHSASILRPCHFAYPLSLQELQRPFLLCAEEQVRTRTHSCRGHTICCVRLLCQQHHQQQRRRRRHQPRLRSRCRSLLQHFYLFPSLTLHFSSLLFGQSVSESVSLHSQSVGASIGVHCNRSRHYCCC